jgi:hypothetical protein
MDLELERGAYHAAVRLELSSASVAIVLRRTMGDLVLDMVSEPTLAKETMPYLILIARRAEMLIAFPAYIKIVNVLPVLVTAGYPMRACAIVTAPTDSTTALPVAVIEEVVPGRAIEVAYRAFMMVRRVANVLLERFLGAIASIATVTMPGRC